MTARTTSSYGGCDPVQMAQDVATHLPSACLPLPNPHADCPECPTGAHLCLTGSSHFRGSVLMEHLLASGPRPFLTLWLLPCSWS